jgi:protein TonB
VLGFSTLADRRKTLVIDFSLEQAGPSVSKVGPAKPTPGQKVQEVPSKKVSSPARNEKIRANPQPVVREDVKPVPLLETPRAVDPSITGIHSTSDLTVPADQAGDPQIAGRFGKTDDPTGGAGKADSLGRGPGGGGGSVDLSGGETARNQYLAEHFTFIRDKILKHLNYPIFARQRGWQGKVVISFIISSNGSIKEARVAQSSGYNVLDQSALAALKESAPFPRPPLEAQIVLPVVYRLD